MISAAEARERTNQAMLIRKINKNIKRCIKKGMYSLYMQIPASTIDELREAITDYLCDLGYDCKIPKRSKDCDWSFDLIEISWEEKE